MVQYAREESVGSAEFVAVLRSSTLGERRPIDDLARIEGMLQNANLIVTARFDGELVGIARSLTDFHYACYLSDLAVDQRHQRRGIGRALIRVTREHLAPKCRLILLAAPAAVDYYPRLGFRHHPQAWTLDSDQALS
ncbi:MAG: GNAT family N-acetyltransferase [Planctomycetota bacterium]